MLDSYGESLDNLIARVEECVRYDGSFVGLTESSSDVAALRVEVDQLRSKSISMLWGEVHLPQIPYVVPSTKFRGAKPSRIVKQLVDGESEQVVDEADNDSATEMDEDEFVRADE
uniref:Uncharacterized protein n=1 Tax=Solanum tuberosum TaxID=4113 RepID=M1D872_SOLTU